MVITKLCYEIKRMLNSQRKKQKEDNEEEESWK